MLAMRANVYLAMVLRYNAMSLYPALSEVMTDADNTPETLVSVPNDLEAAMIVSTLAAHGVDATTSGEFTAGFRAEAPGDVKVLVRRSDLEQARHALDRVVADTSAADENLTSEDSNPGKAADGKRLLLLAAVIVLSIGILQSCL
ncbi:MAG: hypothetical protein ACR2NM_11280 [Bythopirellula sp.]